MADPNVATATASASGATVSPAAVSTLSANVAALSTKVKVLASDVRDGAIVARRAENRLTVLEGKALGFLKAHLCTGLFLIAGVILFVAYVAHKL